MKNISVDLPVVTVRPGELNISASPMILHIILGSCISVTMFGEKLRIGGICHAMLPRMRKDDSADGHARHSGGTASQNHEESFKYVDASIAFMLEKLRALGVGEDELEIKIFGGADMFENTGASSGIVTIGAQNIKTAREIIEARRLKIMNSDVGGREGRVLYFYTHTGEVLVRRIVNRGMYKDYLKKLGNNYTPY